MPKWPHWISHKTQKDQSKRPKAKTIQSVPRAGKRTKGQGWQLNWFASSWFDRSLYQNSAISSNSTAYKGKRLNSKWCLLYRQVLGSFVKLTHGVLSRRKTAFSRKIFRWKNFRRTWRKNGSLKGVVGDANQKQAIVVVKIILCCCWDYLSL